MNLRVMIVGSSESGKSHMAGKLLDYLCDRYKIRVHIFSPVDFDKSLDKNRNGQKPKRYKIYDKSLLNINIDSFTNGLILFDDIEKCDDAEVSKFLKNLRNTVLLRGRHKNISCINVLHEILGGVENKVLNTESNKLIIYPHHNTKHSIKTYLSKYLGISNNQIDDILTLPSRSVYISKGMGAHIVSEKSVFLLD